MSTSSSPTQAPRPSPSLTQVRHMPNDLGVTQVPRPGSRAQTRPKLDSGTQMRPERCSDQPSSRLSITKSTLFGDMISKIQVDGIGESGLNSSSTGTSRSRLPMEDPSTPYFLHPSDGPGLLLVQNKLTGDNYTSWARSMSLALNVKHKIGFINGSISDPGHSDPILHDSWSRNNDIVVSWILNSVSSEIHSSIIYTTIAKEIWDDLKIRFQQSNGPRVFQLRRDLATLTQNTVSVNIYFTRLKSIWDELHTYRPALISCPSNCGNAQKIHGHNQEEYVMAFLMGLNSSFDSLKEQVLLMDPLPPISRVFALATQAERQKLIGQKTQLDLSSSMAFASKNTLQQQQNPRPYNQFKQSSQPNNFKKKDKPICAHCNIQGHTIDKCFKLHGYPPGFQFKPKQQPQSLNQVSDDSHSLPINHNSQPRFCTTDDTNHPISPLLQSFTAEQCQHLMNLFSSTLQCPTQSSNNQTNDSAHISCVSATKCVLNNVSCEAGPRELTAIAGPSGAGKTTLLEVLAGVITPSRVSGHVLVNDMPMDVAHFRRVSGYVTQDEALFPLLTVQETLTYSARLRLNVARDKAIARVENLLKELGLEHVSGARIGSESSRGISGGEKRRVSIGVDLVHDPSVLLLDEPTSGLDSSSALQVMLLLKSMAKNEGKTIVLTIHQPGFRILDLFDKVILLSNGSVLHNGSLNLLEERLKSGGHCLPRHVNVLEFAIDVTESLHEEENDIERTEQEIDDYILNHEEQKHILLYSNSPFKEVLILSQRFSKNIFRTNQLFASRTIQALLAGIVLGTIFTNAFDNSKKIMKLQTQIGFFAFTLTFLISSTVEALPIFLQERRILMRETSRGVYRISSYIIANTLVFLPFLLLVAILYAAPVYWLVGLRHEIDGFLYFSLVVWMVILMSNSFVVCFSALVPDLIMGMSIIAGVMGSFFLFSGLEESKGS
ncbi:hypothetical protein RD792_006317 [Penstemon davidsonii]|uniref:ABC transporter domain-containing protein n=1 Tax=Penstemon davidsonii TaxID=160366 RepID=A0ABR0DCP9_9LAMI|nr:hypothetical protein RD792_006317 [Penstemon davidsonii]